MSISWSMSPTASHQIGGAQERSYHMFYQAIGGLRVRWWSWIVWIVWPNPGPKPGMFWDVSMGSRSLSMPIDTHQYHQWFLYHFLAGLLWSLHDPELISTLKIRRVTNQSCLHLFELFKHQACAAKQMLDPADLEGLPMEFFGRPEAGPWEIPFGIHHIRRFPMKKDSMGVSIHGGIQNGWLVMEIPI